MYCMTIARSSVGLAVYEVYIVYIKLIGQIAARWAWQIPCMVIAARFTTISGCCMGMYVGISSCFPLGWWQLPEPMKSWNMKQPKERSVFHQEVLWSMCHQCREYHRTHLVHVSPPAQVHADMLLPYTFTGSGTCVKHCESCRCVLPIWSHDEISSTQCSLEVRVY